MVSNRKPKMSDIINIKDFYDHETRISIVENAIINIDKRFEHIDRRFEQVDRRFEHLENKMDSHFKWIIGSIGALSLTVILSLLTIIIKIH
jgi:hypothetical protein